MPERTGIELPREGFHGLNAARQPRLPQRRRRTSSAESGWQRWTGRLVAVAFVACALGYIPYHLYARSGFARMLDLRRDLHALETRNAELRSETDRLGREAEALRSDLRAIERVAREEVGWGRRGEIVLDLEGLDAPVTAPTPGKRR